MGEQSRAGMVRQGVRRDQIVVTGHPGFDRLASTNEAARAAVRARYGVGARPMVLFASQPYYAGAFATADGRRAMIRAVGEAAGRCENVQLVVKPHPGERLEELIELVGRSESIVFAEKSADIVPLIQSCDALVTFFSTCALQALYAGKPVINVVFEGSGAPRMYLDSGATLVAQSVEEIVSHLRSVVAGTAQRDAQERERARALFVYEWAHLPDGHATERVARLALQLMEQVRPGRQGDERQEPYTG